MTADPLAARSRWTAPPLPEPIDFCRYGHCPEPTPRRTADLAWRAAALVLVCFATGLLAGAVAFRRF
jgi:hypothetical protein